MKNPEIWQIWTDTLADDKYSEALADPVQTWKNNHQKMCEFIDTNNKLPSQRARDPEEKKIGRWICNQKRNYDQRGSEFSKNIMKSNPEIWQIWRDTLADENY